MVHGSAAIGRSSTTNDGGSWQQGGTTNDGDTVPNFDGCHGVLVVPMSGPGALCILPLQEYVSRYIHTSACIEARNAAAQSLRALMLVARPHTEPWSPTCLV
eukprot:SAG11_NODE_1096_length_5884_cov_4.310631_7_plen_102_part_00